MIETINQIMILCGWITTVGGAIVVLTGAWKKFKKPERDLEKRMQTMEEDIKDIKSKLEKDYTSIRTQRDDMNLGFISSHRAGRISYIHAEKSEEEYKAKLSAREVNFWFDGKPAEFIAALSNNQSLSKEDIKQIRGLLDEMDQ